MGHIFGKPKVNSTSPIQNLKIELDITPHLNPFLTYFRFTKRKQLLLLPPGFSGEIVGVKRSAIKFSTRYNRSGLRQRMKGNLNQLISVLRVETADFRKNQPFFQNKQQQLHRPVCLLFSNSDIKKADAVMPRHNRRLAFI